MVTSQNLPYENCFNVDSVCTLVEILQSKTLYQPDKKAFTFLLDGEAEETSITYRELDLQARAIATRLQDLGASGDRALLIYPPGLEFIAAFFGCLYAGVVAVPAYPPRRNQSLSRLQSIVADAEATIALTTKTVLSNVERQFTQSPTLQALHWLATDNIASDLAQAWLQPAISSDTLAFLQYTSGSTGTPKGVMVSHGNLLYNEQMLQTAFEHTEKTIYVSWLPLFHDMGLIGNILQSLYLGRPCILMSPVAFLQRPVRWLQAISRYKATTSGGPNFAYELCVSKITNEQRETLDLSSWDVAFNGAEPVRAETLERFAIAFEPYGFRREAFYPCYGMAEATLIISGGIKAARPVLKTVQGEALEQHRVVSASGENNDGVRKLVGCGQTLLEQQIVIAHPDTLIRCQPHEVGEIWVSGKNVAQGYWNRSEETQATFRAYEAGTGEGPFLRTGDLGFLQDGELFVTGRLKDLIIIRGRNHYPQDIELTVEHSHPVVQQGCTAAFSVEINGQERLVVACEVERTSRRNLDVDAIGKSISQAVIEQHELEVYAILLLKTGSIPKTSSGKIQRRACRAGFLAGNLDVVGEWRANPESKVESQRRVEEVETRLQQVLRSKQQQSSSRRTNGSQHDSSNREFDKKAQAIQAWLVSNIAERLRVNPQDIEVQQPFSRYGLDSVAAVSLSGELGDWLGRKLSPTLVYDYPTIEALVPRLVEELAKSPNPLDVNAFEETDTEAKDANASDSAIAIIGLGCRFPGASDATAFWQLLRDGVDAITEVPEARWDINALYNSEPATPGKMSTRWGGFLDQVDQFDPHFFAIAPREAERIDPQQRLLLEVAWEALENAGQAPDQLAGSQTGVFIGISSSDYSRLQFEDCDRIDAYTGTGNALSIAANRLSYVLDLRGPSLAVDTACSSSLVAVHLAGQSLQNKECNLALAGGVNLILSPELTITFSQARMMATDGRCKTFSADADGYVRGEGCGVVLLKRLSDALQDGDNILAVIKGSAINQDGRSNGLTAPNGPSQQAVIRQALENAGVAPAQISYVETHGTGTSLGDPIEVDSLKAVLTSDRSPNEPCVLGSVKTNIGHLEAAAGIASLIKVVLCLQHGEIPPQLHLNQLNPYISLEDTSFSIPKERYPWLVGAKRRFAGVSSFGFGGTNAHVVVEEPPVPTKTAIDVERPLHLLTLSAKSENSLKLLAQRYQAFLETNPQALITDVCFTANTGRSHFAHRLAIVSESTVQLQELLGAFVNGKQTFGLVSGQVPSRNRPKIAFLFTGQGSQYVGMGRQLYETQPTFRQALERCDQLLGSYLDQSLLSLLYSASDATDLLHETAYTQPALFALEYALAELWRSWGIVPDVVMGHSLGEYVAACVAGVFSLEEGLLLVVERSRLMQSLPHDGSMAVVFASEERVRAALSSYKTRVVMGEEDESDTFALDQTQVAIASGDAIVSIAAVNGPENIVISGAREAVEFAIAQLQSQEISVQPLQVSHAFHSPLMAPILDEFERKARQVKFKAPRIPLISNLTGKMLKPGEIPDASYWRRHMRETVQFSAGMNALEKQGYELFLELGPSATLLAMGKRCLPKGRGLWLPSLKQGQDDWRVLLNSLEVLEIQGVEVNWAGFDQGYQRRRVPLPTYPFERQRYWFESNKQKNRKLMDVKESDTRLSTPQVETTPKITQRDSIRSQLRIIVAGLLHADSAQIDVHAPFLEMGADSLVILEAVRTIETTFGVKIAIRQFFEGLATIDALANYIDQHITPEWWLKVYPQAEVKPTVPSQHSAVATSVGATEDVSTHGVPNKAEGIAIPKTALERIMAKQLEVMSQQLELLGKQEGSEAEKSLLTQTPPFESLNQTVPNINNSADASLPSQITTDASSDSTSDKTKQDQANAEPILPLRSLKPELNVRLNPDRQRHLEELIARYTKRTQKSKQRKQAYHPVLADSRASAGFRPSIKEMLYPIIGQRAKGSKIWDLDGNEYVDITMGFGVQLFGHDPSFITEALEEQLKQGLHLGPQSDIAGEVAELICEMTGVQRVTFCNSGTEAVMTALRLARTATGRSKIALFSGSYHGHFDGVLAKAQSVDGKLRSVPLAPGVPEHFVEDILVLDYGNPQSLEILQAHAHELAAVLVEPVQSRKPNLQPKTFLQKLRQLTAATGTALILDEVITGFRIHPGGAQAWFDIEADLVTYGKVIGGGLPIGVIAGKATYMNGIDGGLWHYGDASSPHAETTFFAGTYNKHPLAMATARAVLKHLKEHSPALQQELNQRTSQLAETLNTYFKTEDVPIQIVHFGSLFRFDFTRNLDLLFYHLLEKGVYIWEGRSCFLSTAHTDEDIEYVIRAVKESVEELQIGGFFPKPPSKLPHKEIFISGSLKTRNDSYLANNSQAESVKLETNSTEIAPNQDLSNVTQIDANQQPGFWNRKAYKPSLVSPQFTEIKASRSTKQTIQFSLFYFGKYDSEFVPDKYNLLFEGAKFADENGFAALWMPERHFHAFGGFSPNPSVISAALAKVTQRIQLRAGSVVLPLHHPIRVAEEWSIVDNLSKGRVGISFASGWQLRLCKNFGGASQFKLEMVPGATSVSNCFPGQCRLRYLFGSPSSIIQKPILGRVK
jgi:glutamate-1-semialdehyde-2,1-aminomutase